MPTRNVRSSDSKRAHTEAISAGAVLAGTMVITYVGATGVVTGQVPVMGARLRRGGHPGLAFGEHDEGVEEVRPCLAAVDR